MENKEIERGIAKYFGADNRPEVREAPIESLSQRVARQLEGDREVYVSVPFDPNSPRPDWGAIKEYAISHPGARLLVWLNGEIKEL